MDVKNEPMVTADNILMEIDSTGMKALDWVKGNREAIEQRLNDKGALLIRGLNIMSSRQFGGLLSEMFGAELINYTYRSTPRTELRGNVYTATEYHPNETIPQHNEVSYSNDWPMRIGFLCMIPSETGGETPLADSRLVYNNIPARIREEFEEKKIMYVRNYGDIDLPWSEVFQTTDKAVVEQYCTANNMTFEWLENNGLRTKQINQATAIHPVTKEKVWFNQAHLFHVSNLDEETRNSLLTIMGEESLPRNTYFGDGSPINEADLQVIRDVYEEAKFSFPWQRNDFLLLDNMLFTHGRKPFTGERKVLVGMARPYSQQ